MAERWEGAEEALAHLARLEGESSGDRGSVRVRVRVRVRVGVGDA